MVHTDNDLGSGPTAMGRHDGQTSRLGGEFLDSDLEHEYRLWRYDATLSQYKITGWLLALAVVPYVWTTYKVFGATTDFAILVCLRAALLAVSVWVMVAAYRRGPYRQLDRSALCAAALLLVTNAATMTLIETIGNLMIIQGLMLLTVCYVLFPGRLISIVPPLLLFSVIFLYSVLTRSGITATEGPAIIVWTLIANTVGFLSARQFNRFRRSEYVAIRRAEAHVVELQEAQRIAERARAEAEEANRAKSAMLANTSHELRTPLNAIIGFSEMIMRQMLGPIGQNRYQQYAEDINGSGRHLLRLIDDLLDLSKIEAGKTELHCEWIEAEDIAGDAIKLVWTRAEAEGIDLATDISPELGSLFADERSMRQILINLLTNAVKFSPSGSRVSLVGWMETDGSARLQIRDQGPGFETSEIQRLLQPFQQAESDANQPREGWGLGLALVNAMCELNGIAFTLENHSDGGACATVTFPPPLVRPAPLPRLVAAS